MIIFKKFAIILIQIRCTIVYQIERVLDRKWGGGNFHKFSIEGGGKNTRGRVYIKTVGAQFFNCQN